MVWVMLCFNGGNGPWRILNTSGNCCLRDSVGEFGKPDNGAAKDIRGIVILFNVNILCNGSSRAPCSTKKLIPKIGQNTSAIRNSCFNDSVCILIGRERRAYTRTLLPFTAVSENCGREEERWGRKDMGKIEYTLPVSRRTFAVLPNIFTETDRVEGAVWRVSVHPPSLGNFG